MCYVGFLRDVSVMNSLGVVEIFNLARCGSKSTVRRLRGRVEMGAANEWMGSKRKGEARGMDTLELADLAETLDYCVAVKRCRTEQVSALWRLPGYSNIGEKFKVLAQSQYCC